MRGIGSVALEIMNGVCEFEGQPLRFGCERIVHSRPSFDFIETSSDQPHTGEDEIYISVTERLEATRQEIKHSNHRSEDSGCEKVIFRQAGFVGRSEVRLLIQRVLETAEMVNSQ